jgi:hypothetical protein
MNTVLIFSPYLKREGFKVPDTITGFDVVEKQRVVLVEQI